MSNKPKYITELEIQVGNMEKQLDDTKKKLERSHEYYKEMRDNYDGQSEVNAQVLQQLGAIIDCLKGSEFNGESGGLVKKVTENKHEIDCLKNRLSKREGILVTITVFITAVISTLVGYLFNKN